MSGLNATELANRLGVSKPRISQYVSSGKLDGCYVGEGRARRFDPDKAAAALGRRLDLGQMTGNGAATRKTLREMNNGEPPPKDSDQLSPNDPDRLELATIQIKEEEARRRRRENAREEGLWVLAEEVQRHTARALAQEIGQFDTVLRDGARAVADALGVDARTVRKIMVDQWRDHRARRSDQLAQQAGVARMTDAEKAEAD
jgi:transcriptional regulator with XRE-family HTH domain